MYIYGDLAYGNTTSDYFGIEPPTLEQYFNELGHKIKNVGRGYQTLQRHEKTDHPLLKIMAL